MFPPVECRGANAQFATDAVVGDPMQLPVTNDNSIVIIDGEWDLNAGQKGRIRGKGNQHMAAMAFDTSAIGGNRIRRTLVRRRTAGCQLRDLRLSERPHSRWWKRIRTFAH